MGKLKNKVMEAEEVLGVSTLEYELEVMEFLRKSISNV